MAKLSILAGATSQSVNVFIQNSSSTTGAGLTGLVFNSSGLIAYYTFAGANATAVSITLATLATVTTAYSAGGFIEIDSTHMPGVYRLDLPSGVLAASKGRSVLIYLSGATNMAPCVLEIELTGTDNQDAVHGGMSALPNTACTGNASLITSGTGTDQLSVASGRIDIGKALGTAVTLDANNVLNVSTKYVGGTLQTARDIGASVLLSAGTGTGQLDFTSGVVKANLAQILGTVVSTPATAGILDCNVKNWNNNAALSDSGGFPEVDVERFKGTASAGTAGYVGIDWGQVTNKTTGNALTGTTISSLQTLAAVSSVTGDVSGKVLGGGASAFTSIGVQADVEQWKGSAAPANTGDAFARLGAPAGASVSADVAAINAKTTNLPGSPAAVGSQMDLVNAPNATALNAAADATLDRAAGVETGWTVRQAFRIFLAALGGLVSGAGTSAVTITNPGNTKNRIVATVDASGDRSAITYDVT
jgi:hypothetical protein